MKCLVDSCIFIENFKGKKEVKKLFLEAIECFECFITEVIFSEVFYKVIGLEGSRSPLTLKKKGSISYILKKENVKNYIKLLTMFNTLKTNKFIFEIAYELAENYNILPNDALILATCKHYGIKYLISLDEDFKESCEKERIVLIDSAEKLKEILK